jgi:peptidoglycan/LPS O-acetylase OafA/YrhL
VTIADAVLALVAVVALLLTLPAVAMVASLVSTMAADAFISALTIVPSTMFALATVMAVGNAPVASLERAIAAEALMSALTMTPAAIEVALPTEVTSPVRLALVVTVAALPVIEPDMFELNVLTPANV